MKEGIWHIELPTHTYILWPPNQLLFPGKKLAFPSQKCRQHSQLSPLLPLCCQPTSVIGQGTILGTSVQLMLKEANSPKKGTRPFLTSVTRLVLAQKLATFPELDKRQTDSHGQHRGCKRKKTGQYSYCREHTHVALKESNYQHMGCLWLFNHFHCFHVFSGWCLHGLHVPAALKQ